MGSERAEFGSFDTFREERLKGDIGAIDQRYGPTEESLAFAGSIELWFVGRPTFLRTIRLDWSQRPGLLYPRDPETSQQESRRARCRKRYL